MTEVSRRNILFVSTWQF